MRSNTAYFQRVILTVTVIMAAFIGLLATGWLDPRPTGGAVKQWPPATHHTLPASEKISWLGSTLPPPPFDLRLTAASTGAADIGYGLALRTSAGLLVIAVSPAGYLSIWQSARGQTEVIYPWRTWPHIRADENELWLTATAAALTIRINREIFAQLPLTAAPQQAGKFSINFEAEQAAVIQFAEVLLFTNE